MMGASSVHLPLPCVLGNPPQHPGLVHAAFPEHALAAGGTVCARGGSDVVPFRPIQVSGLWVTQRLEGTGWCFWGTSPGPPQCLAQAQPCSLSGGSHGSKTHLLCPTSPGLRLLAARAAAKPGDVDMYGHVGRCLSDQVLCRCLTEGTVSSWALGSFCPLALRKLL